MGNGAGAVTPTGSKCCPGTMDNSLSCLLEIYLPSAKAERFFLKEALKPQLARAAPSPNVPSCGEKRDAAILANHPMLLQLDLGMPSTHRNVSQSQILQFFSYSSSRISCQRSMPMSWR